MFFALCGCVFGQEMLTLSSASAAAGGTATLNLTMKSAGTPQAAGVQWTISYAAADFTAIHVATGPAAQAAGKSASCNTVAGSYKCLVFGLNNSAISNGVIATITLAVSSSTTATSAAVQIVDALGAGPAGNAVTVSGTTGTVSISPSRDLTSLECKPNPVPTPDTASCTVSVSAAAPSGGFAVVLKSSAASVSVPASVTIAKGDTSAMFHATASKVTSATSARLAASLAGSSKSVSLELAPPSEPLVTKFACSPTALASNTSATCKVSLSAAAPSKGSDVEISLSEKAPLTVPASITVKGGSASASFSVRAGSISSNETETVKASLNGSSVTCSIKLTQ